MDIRSALPDDAEALVAIYAPIVLGTAISFEYTAPDAADMRGRIAKTLAHLPWLVAIGDDGALQGYAYATPLRERAAYQWSVETSAYVHEQARGGGVGKRLYGALLERLAALGYMQAFAGIALPNPASVALHESVGFTPIGVYRNVGFKLGRWHDLGRWQRPLQACLPAEPDPPRLP